MDRPRGQKRWPLVEFRVSIVKFQGWSLTRTLNVVKLHVLFEGHGAGGGGRVLIHTLISVGKF